jgi:hypothetical protein
MQRQAGEIRVFLIARAELGQPNMRIFASRSEAVVTEDAL